MTVNHETSVLMFVYKYSITIKTKNKNKNKSYRTENSTYASTLMKESHYCYNVIIHSLGIWPGVLTLNTDKSK